MFSTIVSFIRNRTKKIRPNIKETSSIEKDTDPPEVAIRIAQYNSYTSVQLSSQRRHRGWTDFANKHCRCK